MKQTIKRAAQLACMFSLVAVADSSFGQPSPDVPFTVSRLFSEGMVAQRNAIVPVWGTAPSGSSVTLSFDGAFKEVEAGPDGTWRGTLEPHPAGGPHTLTISAGDSTLEIQDVWFGDVWIASGQSNMAWKVAEAADAENEIRTANDPRIQHFKVPFSWSYESEASLAGGEWHPADSAHVGAFSAVGYYFARSVRTSIDIPIGIINTSRGSSRIETWMDREALGVEEDELAAILAEHRQRLDNLKTEILKKHPASLDEDPGLRDDVAVWADPDMDVADWTDIIVPSNWEAAGYPEVDGVAWYRTTVDLTEDQIGSGLATLFLSQVDDDDMTWINGTLVGQTWGWTIEREYAIPQGVLRPGQNTIAVRVQDGLANGGMLGDAERIRLETESASIPLAGTWKFRIGKLVINPGGRAHKLPTLLYNKMVHPLLPYPVTGFLWYQGEANTGSDDAVAYAGQFSSLISGWREAWGVAEAPFLFVQLASYHAALDQPGESNWAVLRESQSTALSLPFVGQAVTTDIGEADDIHPKNKQDVGYRLALAARHLAYGEDIVYSGPTFREHRVEDGLIKVEFDNVGSGLIARGGQLGGFAVAGSDGQFVWADAHIVGSTVVVSSASIENPVAVRYAWADNPDRANLYNKEGLPAAPFRATQ